MSMGDVGSDNGFTGHRVFDPRGVDILVVGGYETRCARVAPRCDCTARELTLHPRLADEPETAFCLFVADSQAGNARASSAAAVSYTHLTLPTSDLV